MRASVQPYAENGVNISKAPISVGDTVTISYEGLLVRSGANEVIAHIGYGESWQEKAFIPMVNDNGVFKADIKVELSDVLNVSFKDGADNWDNNSYNNYSFQVTEKAKKTVKKASEKPAEEKKVAVKKVAAPKAAVAKKSTTKPSEEKKTAEKAKTTTQRATTKKTKE